MPKKNRGKGQRSKSGINAGKNEFIASSTSAGSAVRVRVKDDVKRAATVPDISRIHMPKKLQTQIHWFSTSLQFTKVIASSGSLTEFNFGFSLGDTAISGGIAGLFDQYAIFAINLRYIIQVTNAGAAAIPTYTTAIDYDSIGNLGNIATLRGYSTACTSSIAEIQERYIEPCNAPALYSGSTFTHYGTARMWVDNANVSTPHYGMRCMLQDMVGGTGNIVVECTYVICARNVI